MAGTNPVGTWQDPNFQAQTGTAYKTALDNAIKVAKRLNIAFAPHEQSTPNMTVRLDAGFIFTSAGALTEVAAQSSATITAPVTNPRIDRIVIDKVTGAVSVVAGTEAASPTPPAIPTGKLPVAQVLLQTSTTTITNQIITDERIAIGSGSEFASGVRMMFDQAAAPTGWTLETGLNDRTFLIDSAAGGTNGGTWTISGLTASDHTHSVTPNSSSFPYDTGTANTPAAPTAVTSGGASALAVSSNGAWRPLHRKIIIAQKN